MHITFKQNSYNNNNTKSKRNPCVRTGLILVLFIDIVNHLQFFFLRENGAQLTKEKL